MNVQRWHLYSPIMREESETGEWVTYADHVAALAEAEQRVRDTTLHIDPIGHAEKHYTAGRAEALREAREAVAALVRVKSGTGEYVRRSDALAAIDALGGTDG
jgi:selenocysteine lyase/cysteine desulfurase